MRSKDIINYLFNGIAWGCTFLVVVNLIGYLAIGAAYLQPLVNNFTNHVIGSMFVGICCGSTSYVYKLDNLTLRKQIIIHFTIGISSYLLIAYKLGWMPVSNICYIIIFILIAVIIFTIIWSIFYFYNRSEAQKYNAKIKELYERDESEGGAC